jgi:disulfide bond formation protein DsbB
VPATPSLSRIAAAVLLALPVTLAAACGGGGGGEAAGGADPAQVAAGEKVFMTTCATCHGRDAMGLPRLGKGLHHNQFVESKTDAEMVEFIKTGRPASHELNTTGVDMPPKGGNPALNDQDIQNVVSYVRTLQ